MKITTTKESFRKAFAKAWNRAKGQEHIPDCADPQAVLGEGVATVQHPDGHEEVVKVIGMDLSVAEDRTAQYLWSGAGGGGGGGAMGPSGGGGGGGSGGFYLASGTVTGRWVDELEDWSELVNKKVTTASNELKGRVEEAARALERKGEHETDATKALGYSLASKELRRLLASLNGDVAGYLMEGQDE